MISCFKLKCGLRLVFPNLQNRQGSKVNPHILPHVPPLIKQAQVWLLC